jgi:hypothetical protein
MTFYYESTLMLEPVGVRMIMILKMVRLIGPLLSNLGSRSSPSGQANNVAGMAGVDYSPSLVRWAATVFGKGLLGNLREKQKRANQNWLTR